MTNLSLCQREGQSFTLIAPTEKEINEEFTTCIYLYPGNQKFLFSSSLHSNTLEMAKSTRNISGAQYGYVRGRFGEVPADKSFAILYGFPCLTLDLYSEEPRIEYNDFSTVTRISRSPLQEDVYEKVHVYVAPSLISPLAGEGLFARKTIKKGQLVSLFNGVRRHKEGRKTTIGADSEEWSDYRLVLGKYFAKGQKIF